MKPYRFIVFLLILIVSSEVISEMNVKHTHHIDKGEQDDQGYYDYYYYYEYDLYEYCEESVCFVARSYVDEPDRASFIRKVEGGMRGSIMTYDIKSELLQSAIHHLKSIGKKEIQYLGGQGYKSV